MREKQIEAYLVKVAKQHGGVAEKFTSPGRRSVPDRLVQLPRNRIWFVECKATGQKPTEGQARDHEKRRARGHAVFVVDSYESVDALPWAGSVHS